MIAVTASQVLSMPGGVTALRHLFLYGNAFYYGARSEWLPPLQIRVSANGYEYLIPESDGFIAPFVGSKIQHFVMTEGNDIAIREPGELLTDLGQVHDGRHPAHRLAQ